jgi:hypothetical protein
MSYKKKNPFRRKKGLNMENIVRIISFRNAF